MHQVRAGRRPAPPRITFARTQTLPAAPAHRRGLRPRPARRPGSLPVGRRRVRGAARARRADERGLRGHAVDRSVGHRAGPRRGGHRRLRPRLRNLGICEQRILVKSSQAVLHALEHDLRRVRNRTGRDGSQTILIGTATAGVGLSLGMALPGLAGAETAADAASATPEVNAWVVIKPDDTVIAVGEAASLQRMEWALNPQAGVS